MHIQPFARAAGAIRAGTPHRGAAATERASSRFSRLIEDQMTAAGQRREAGAAGIREYGYGRKLNAANRPKIAAAISRITIQPRTTLISACATNPAASHPRPSRRNRAPETSTHLRTP